jgi:nucleotide-binding universal stress UspA family protein
MRREESAVGLGGSAARASSDDGPASRTRGRVVVGVDDSPGGRAALDWALRTAAARGTLLEVVSAFAVDYYWSDANLLDPRRIDRARHDTEDRTRALVDEVRRDGEVASVPGVGDVEVQVLVVAGAAAEHLVDRSRNADLLVVGSRGRGAVAGALLGSVSLRCVMHAHCPVVVVHDVARPRLPVAERPTVVVGVDGSPTARGALEVAAREARSRGARLEVVGAYQPADTWSDVDAVVAVPVEELRRDVRSTVSAEVSDVLGAEGTPNRPPVEIVVVEGAPAEVLVQRADQADLLVVGSRGRGTLPGLVLGSVALRTVVRAGCPVMVVRPQAMPESPSADPRESVVVSAPAG